MLFSAAARDAKVAAAFDAFGTRVIGPAEMTRRALPRAIAVTVRHRIGGRDRAQTPAGVGGTAATA
jgi:hypothetical protein